MNTEGFWDAVSALKNKLKEAGVAAPELESLILVLTTDQTGLVINFQLLSFSTGASVAVARTLDLLLAMLRAKYIDADAAGKNYEPPQE